MNTPMTPVEPDPAIRVPAASGIPAIPRPPAGSAAQNVVSATPASALPDAVIAPVNQVQTTRVFSITMLVLSIVGLVAFVPSVFFLVLTMLSPDSNTPLLAGLQVVVSIIVFGLSILALHQATRAWERTGLAVGAVTVSAITMALNLIIGLYFIISAASHYSER